MHVFESIYEFFFLVFQSLADLSDQLPFFKVTCLISLIGNH